MYTRLSLLLFSIFLIFVVTLLISYAKTVKRSIKAAFWFIFIGLAAWQANIYIADTQTHDLVQINNLVFLWPPMAIYATGWFIYLLEIHKTDKEAYRAAIHSRFILLLSGLFIIQSLLAIFGSLFENVYRDAADELIFIRGPLYGLYIGAIAVSILAVLIKLYSIFRLHGKGTQERNATKIVLYAMILAFGYAIITNAVIPLVTNSQSLIGLGVFTADIFAIGLSFSIIKYKFLDIRLIIARSVAYILSLGILFIGYILLSSLLIEVLLNGDGISATTTFVNVMVLAPAVLLYQPLKRFFDRVTNKLFYRDAYDPQVFLDQLNKTVISNIELGILLRHSAEVIEANLKCEYVLFGVFRGSAGKSTRYMGTAKTALSPHDMRDLRSLSIAKKVIDNDLIEPENPELYKVLNRNNVAVLASLTTSIEASHEPVAYMLLGPKKSGNRYSQQDLQIIEIISDELVVAIQNALRFEEIQNFNVTLQEKVDDATKKLRKTNEKLKEMDETKDDFISMASHQLRTPLTSVKGYLSMVLEGDAGKVTAQQRKMLEQAFVSSQRMTYLISDLLNVSRLKTGKFVIERTPTNLVDMVQQEIAQLTEAAKGRNLTLIFNPPKDFPTLMLDETKTRQLVMNFVDNAIYYTPPGGTIEIKMVDNPNSVEFTVVDNGLGVPRRDQPHLFTKFYRANNARKARPDGTGLGLFMAKKVVIAQGGAIIFRSQEGKGSTFGFTFPKSKELIEIK
jgi:signal transduction histidine kinase